MIDYFGDDLFLFRLFAVVFLIGGFYLLVKAGVLDEMPGFSYVDHSEAIVFILLPLSVWTWIFWVVGIVLYLDDVIQSWRRAHGNPEYRSWIHLNGWWYIQRPVFNFFGISTE